MLRGSQQPEKANAADAFRDAALDAAGRALWRHDGHDLVVAGVSAWAGPSLVLDVARRTAAEVVQPGASALSHALDSHLDCRIPRRHSRRHPRHRHARGSVEYRYAVCVRAGVDWGHHPAL